MRPVASGVCEACARRAWLLGRLAAHLDAVRSRIDELLELDDASLVAAVAGRDRDAVSAELAALDPAAERVRRERAGVDALCRCDPEYPTALRELPAPPAVLHLAVGGPDATCSDGPDARRSSEQDATRSVARERLASLLAEAPVAIVGSRRPTIEGNEAARSLAGELASTGLTIVSGLALGIDAAAHEGALGAGGATIAVLPAGAERAYPRAHRRLHARIGEHGLVISELPVGIVVRRWMFPARNRLIAALSAMTVVVQAGERSGALLTAGWASRLGRPVGAVPGRIRSSLARGPHELLRRGAALVEGADDVLDAVYGADGGPRRGADERSRLAMPGRPRLAEPLATLRQALADGEDGPTACASAGLDIDGGLAALAALELAGYVRRGPGGRYAVRW